LRSVPNSNFYIAVYIGLAYECSYARAFITT